ncbi:hypothetical protein LINGRAHAP2_LOCUS4408 [Linum grandiflorum]
MVTMSGPARVVWPLHPSSSFTVKSFMAVLRREAFPGVDEFPWRCIWKQEVPTKVQGFLWLVFYDQSVSHIFLSCHYSRKVWELFSSTLSISGPLHHSMREVIA